MRRIIVLTAFALAVMPTAAEAAPDPGLVVRSKDVKLSKLNFGADCSAVVACTGYITVSFTGSEPFTLNGWSASDKEGAFGLGGDATTCVFRTYQPGESCTIGVQFHPGAYFPPLTGKFFGMVCVGDNVDWPNWDECQWSLRGHA
jgi:hypothetical protein